MNSTLRPYLDHGPAFAEPAADAIPVHLVASGSLASIDPPLDDRERRFCDAQNFKGENGGLVLLPDLAGGIGRVLFGLGSEADRAASPVAAGRLATALPPGTYRLAAAGEEAARATLAFLLGSYQFNRYRKPKKQRAKLVRPAEIDGTGAERIRDAVFLARDLINTPANDLSPADLAEAARGLAERFGAECAVISGEALERDFPLLHAVGAGSDRPPCLVDFRWGHASHPKVTLVGKGIVFDTGGVDIKPASGMLTMKKDMGGAANVLGLASMIMSAGLKVRLRVIIPAAENSIGGLAFRPGDVIRSRKGLTVEIGNTDAEGRLVLADGLALADEESPDLLVTMSTLTGAARVALGPDLPPFYTDDDGFAGELAAAATKVHDPLWRMPLWAPYDAWLSSKVADLNNVAGNSYAGSIVAALFLKRFVEQSRTFAHFDIFAWNPSARPTGPEGGEAQAIRALFQLLGDRYG